MPVNKTINTHVDCELPMHAGGLPVNKTISKHIDCELPMHAGSLLSHWRICRFVRFVEMLSCCLIPEVQKQRLECHRSDLNKDVPFSSILLLRSAFVFGRRSPFYSGFGFSSYQSLVMSSFLQMHAAFTAECYQS